MGCNNSKISFIVKAPVNTDQVTIAGNLSQLGDWDPSKKILDKTDDSLFTITINIPKNSEIEYKFTRGSWKTEALTENGIVPDNFKIIVKNDTTINHSIHKWRDENNLLSNITGNEKYHENFYSPQLDNERDVIVWLPPNYDKAINKNYPVLYLNDGQNVFDPTTSFLGIDWQLDETVTSLINEDRMKEIIMVGIYNTDDRTSEYSPKHKGEKYSEFLINTLKPFIDATYRTLKDAENTAVMGSSIGGSISFHIAWEYPDVFTMAGCLSPAFLVDDNEIVHRVKKDEENKTIKIVIFNGTKGLESELQPAITEMVNVLESKSFDDLIYKIFNGAEHNESAWAKQVEIPLLYFFEK